MQRIHIIKIVLAIGFTSLAHQLPFDLHMECLSSLQHALVHPSVFNLMVDN
jgi:hypothetical protein